MNINLRKILNALFIFTVTAAAGFLITAVSFNLFDRLTVNEMRILFTLDILLLLVCGGYFLYHSDKKRVRKERCKKEKLRKINKPMPLITKSDEEYLAA